LPGFDPPSVGHIIDGRSRPNGSGAEGEKGRCPLEMHEAPLGRQTFVGLCRGLL